MRMEFSNYFAYNEIRKKKGVEAHVPGRRTRAACAGRMTQDEQLVSQFD